MTSQRQFWSQGCRSISVRGLLILVAMPCVLLGMEASRVHRSQKAIARINELGGGYGYTERLPFTLWMNSPVSPPRWLKRLVGDKWFRRVVLISIDYFDEGSHDLTDDDLALLRYLPDVRDITLVGMKNITDGGLVHFSNLKHLETLNLDGTRVRGPGLRHVRAQNLSQIMLRDTPFTDEGLIYLANRPNLRSLALSGTKITDEGVSALQNLPSLGYLEIFRTAITAEGRARLQKVLPKCGISH